MRRFTTTIAVAALAICAQARADDGPASTAAAPAPTDAAKPPTAPAASRWKIAVGPGVYLAPAYPGARRFKLYPFPALDISYDDRFFSQGPDVLGVNVLRAENYHVGTALTFDFQSRNASDDPHLHGLGDVHDGPKLKLFADYTVWAFTGSFALLQDIAGNGQGLTASADLYASLPVTGWLFSVGPGLTWASAAYTRKLFGVSPAQSAASGLPAYSAGAGVRDVHVTFYASHDFTKHWAGSLNTTLGRLQGDAAHSPITERHTELTAFAALNYKF
ncbi:MipA/OmpV family protein [Trinickia diaoshuihuensis]|uniref:MipA/OmpV family protein n=1 Tax=Trinickia diaoshuihuensis TaxID=2292265 RepID=UPI000E274900|nr:MipA/OmpV family protein [Trinickia diaoshuihuensis]